MRKLFERLTRTLKDFYSQRDDLILLVACGDGDVALVLKALRELDRNSPGGVFLLFGEDFDTPDSFVTGLAQRLQEELTLTNDSVGPGEERLPQLPAEFLDPKNPPLARLEPGLRYAQALINPRQGQKFLWGMCPGKISDPKSYLELLAQLTPQPEIRPWMRGARIVARVPVDFQLDRSPLAGAERVNVEPFVIPPDAHEQGLLADAADPKLPLADRMQAEVQLGYLDYAHGQFDQATGRFRKALAFFQWAEIPVMEGLVLSGLGDIARRQENWKQAQHWYACAAVPAAAAGSPILLANIVQNLALVAYHEGRFADAEERYAELATLKLGMLDEVGLAEALEWEGICQEKQNAYDRAVESWEEAASVCKTFEMKDRFTPMLAHVRRAYEKLNLREELQNFDKIWKA
jgi:tetratricopeptide (TPR) repeat protein